MPNAIHQASTKFFLGVDGGGTTTRALIADEKGTAWGYGEAGSSNPHERGIEAAAAQLEVAVTRAWANLSLGPRPLSGAFFGIAGAGSLTARERAVLIRNMGFASGVTAEVDHDLRIALEGAMPGKPGIIVIAGTGSAGYGRDLQGETTRVGGWGALLDDVGGGYWMGVQALAAILQSFDGRGPTTRLHNALLPSLQIGEPPQILTWLRMPTTDRTAIAALAPLVFSCAREGDPTAREILTTGAAGLAEIAAAAARRLFGARPAPVALLGGLSQISEYADAFRAAVAARAPQLSVVQGEYSALVGALALAARAQGTSPSPQWLRAAEAHGKPDLA